MDELAKLMGFKGQSSIQRYLSPDYDKEYRPEIARRFRSALIDRGDPPITDDDLKILLQWKQLEPDDPAYPSFDAFSKVVDKIEQLKPTYEGSDRFRVSLPILEGEITIELPNYISEESAAAARKWFEHLIGFTAEVGHALQRFKPPTPPKKW